MTTAPRTYAALATLFALSTLAASGCSAAGSASDAPQDDGGRATADGRPGGGPDGAADPSAGDEDCSEPVEDRPALSTCVRHVTGRAVDVAGKPLAALVISICGGVCYFSKTAADGSFDAHVGRFIDHARFSVLIHGRPKYASLFNELPAPTGDRITLDAAIVVPQYDALGTVLPADGSPAGSATAGAVTVSWPAGTEFELDIEDVADKESGRTLKSGRWADLTKVPAFATGQNLLSLYALAPFGMKTCTKRPCASTNLVKLSVTLANETGLPAGTAVELVVLQTDLFSVPNTAGKAKVAATGKVSADGKTITTDAGQGLSTLTWVGVRKK